MKYSVNKNFYLLVVAIHQNLKQTNVDFQHRPRIQSGNKTNALEHEYQEFMRQTLWTAAPFFVLYGTVFSSLPAS